MTTTTAGSQEALHFLDYWRIIRARKEIVIAVFLLIVLTGTLVTYTLPKTYQGSVVIQVREETPDLPVFEKEGIRFDPLFLRTQFQIIQSAPVIEEVVRKRGLDKKLAKAYHWDMLPAEKAVEKVFKKFSRSMKVQHYRDTNLIEIRVELSEPKGSAHQEAAAAANMVAQVYHDRNMSRSLQMIKAALSALRESLDEQEEAVAAAAEKVEDIRQRYQLTVLSDPAGSESTIDKLSLTRLEVQRVAVMTELAEKKARYDKILSLSGDELLAAAPYVVGDPAIASLVAAKRQAEVQISELLMSSLGPKHPDVIRAQAVIDELRSTIEDALRGLKTGLQADYEAAMAKFNALEGMLEKTKATERESEARGYREFDKALEALNHARRIRDALEMRYLQEKIQLNIPRTTVEVVEPARAADENDPVSPNIMLNTLLSILLGLFSGIGLAFFVEYIDTSVKTIEDVERYMGVPVIGVIPQRVKPFVDKDSHRDHAEAYRMLRTNLRFSERMKGARTFCVTSGSVAEGKSLTVFNLAYVCAQLGDKVLIVDSDLHRPRQHKILGVSNRIGLANILVDEETIEACLVETGEPNLQLLPSGKLARGVHGLLDTVRMRELIEELISRYDIVIFDAPPIIGVSDASLLAREMDGVLLVVQHRKYPRSVSMRAKGMVDNAGGTVAGVVLNNINISRDYSYYYHYSYYSYKYPRQPRLAEEAVTKA